MTTYIQSITRITKEAVSDVYFWFWFIPYAIFFIAVIEVLFGIVEFDHSYQLGYPFSSGCKTLSNEKTLVMLIGIFIDTYTALLVVGSLMSFSDAKRQNKNISRDYFGMVITIIVLVIATFATLTLAGVWC